MRWKRVGNMAHNVFWQRGKAGLLAAFFLLSVLIVFGGGSASSRTGSDSKRADVLEIKLFEAGEDHEMPAVFFFHDQHTRALEEKSCDACHPENPDNPEELSFSFKQTGEISKQAAKKLYHDECIGCHKKRAGDAREAGPLTSDCRGCHQKKPRVESSRKLISFDRSLHYRHESAEPITYQPSKNDDNCGACHHEYDEQAEELVYREGEEGSCRYCHKQQKEDDTRSFPTAAHDDCVNCHLRFEKDDIKAGPVDCKGCHSAEGLDEIDRVEDVPRLERGQPDALIMADWLKAARESGEMPSQLMAAAAFDHLQHEKTGPDTCRKCHHESLEACRECHKSKGVEEGGFVSLEQAMHAPDSDRSCMGCHDAEKTAADCAGCHVQMPEKRLSGRDCQTCHSLGPDRFKRLLPADEKQIEAFAESAVKERPDRIETVADEKVPEKVEIDAMVDQYEAAEMPHRKIVQALTEKMRDNSLAAVFHTRQETLCAGCHHNSPPSLNPPGCASCHPAGKAVSESGRPGLKGAYHGQCIGCHQQMGLEKPAATDCKACHEKRNNSQ